MSSSGGSGSKYSKRDIIKGLGVVGGVAAANSFWNFGQTTWSFLGDDPEGIDEETAREAGRDAGEESGREAGKDAGEESGREAAEEEIERSFQQITFSDLDYDMVEEGLDYVEDELGSEYAEELITRRQFDLWGEDDDVDYIEAKLTFRVNENRESVITHEYERDEDDESITTGRWNNRFETAKTFLEGIDKAYDENILEQYSDEDPNEADLEHLAELGYEEEVLENYDEW